MTLGIGLVGAGAVAELHARALAQTSGVTLRAVTDRDEGRASDLASRAGAAARLTLTDLLDDPAVDAVYVLTPAESHVGIARHCLHAGKHVLIEKPVAPTPEEVETVDREARSAGLVAFPGHNYLYLPECARVIRQARQGLLGAVRYVSVTYAIRHPEALAAHYGSVLDEVMVHHAAITLALCGRPDAVHGGVSTPAWQKLRTDDQAWMAWEYSSGCTALMFASFAVDDTSADPVTFSVKVLGTEGSAAMSWRSLTGTGGPFAVGLPLYEETYVHEAAAFRDAVTEGRSPLSNLNDAAEIARLLRTVRQGVST